MIRNLYSVALELRKFLSTAQSLGCFV